MTGQACPCGCGTVVTDPNNRGQKYATPACGTRMYRQRRQEAAVTAQQGRGKVLRCPGCGTVRRGTKAMALHLLQEAGAKGVTTSQFLLAGCGNRFGGRLHELKHEDGIDYLEERVAEGEHRYWLAAPVAVEAPVLAPTPEPAPDRLFALGAPGFDELVPPRNAINDDLEAA